MKVIKRGLFLLVILLFGVVSVRSALATPVCKDTDELPGNGTYGFEMQGSNVAAPKDVPTSGVSGVFTTTAVSVVNASFFNVTNGSFILNDDGNVCTGNFSGTGACQASQVTAGTMNLTLANLTDVTPGGCATIDSVGGSATLAYGLFNGQGAMFLMDADLDTYSAVGEAQKQ